MKITLILLCFGSLILPKIKQHLAMQKVKIYISVNDNAVQNVDSSYVYVEMTNLSDNIVKYDENSLIGFHVFGKNDTYNFKSRYDLVPGRKVGIKPNETIYFNIDIAELWRDYKPSESADYTVVLKFQIENEIYLSNKQTLRLSI